MNRAFRLQPKIAKTICLLVSALCAVGLSTQGVNAGYNAAAAAQYADQWATRRNTSYYMDMSPNDCANFVSQAMRAGGYSTDGLWGTTSDDHNWYYIRWGCGHGGTCYSWTRSWSLVADFDTFLAYDYPGGWDWGSYYGNQASASSGVLTGDVVIFDFGDGNGKSHMAIQVLTGTNYVDWGSGSPWYGDEVDAHTNDRYHAYWALTPYNPRWSQTTTIYVDHIDPNND